MNYSNHAIERLQERGIPQFAIDCVLEFGEVEYHEGREIHRMSKRSERKLKAYMGPLSAQAARLSRCVYVVTAGDQVVTVARQTKHLKRDR